MWTTLLRRKLRKRRKIQVFAEKVFADCRKRGGL
jgi:hypothetical protein